jgi:hypothetical protein
MIRASLLLHCRTQASRPLDECIGSSRGPGLESASHLESRPLTMQLRLASIVGRFPGWPRTP